LVESRDLGVSTYKAVPPKLYVGVTPRSI